MNKRKLFVVSGSSGVGKGTVIKELLKRNPNIVLSISCTTRQKRDGEIDGVHYFFVSKTDFNESIKNDEFIEWAEFSGNFYGTKKSFVREQMDNQKEVLLEIETKGALQIKQKLPETVLIFIEPPSYQDLEFRLRNRKTETEEAIQKRLDQVKLEMRNSQSYDYRVVNDTVENAVFEIEKIIKTEISYA